MSAVDYDAFQRLVLPRLYPPDEKPIYKIDTKEVASLTKSFAAEHARQSAKNSNRNHNLTYGEVTPASIEGVIIPLLGDLTPDDVFYDLGSGTGKIPLQVAMQTPVGMSKGIEFAANRAGVASDMLARLQAPKAEPATPQRTVGAKRGRAQMATTAPVDLTAAVEAALGTKAARPTLAGLSEASAAKRSKHVVDKKAEGGGGAGDGIEAALAACVGRVEAIHGDFLKADLDDATVIFINNAVFEADLMAALLRKLAKLPRLRRVVTLRKLCYRHGRRCQARKEPCCCFSHPPEETTVKPTWCSETTAFAYTKVQATMESYFRPEGGGAQR